MINHLRTLWIPLLIVLGISACGTGEKNSTDPTLENAYNKQTAVGGQIIGLKNSIGLFDGTQTFNIDRNGSFLLPATYNPNNPYKITIARQPSGQTCYIENEEGNAQQDVSAIVIVCVDNEKPAINGKSISSKLIANAGRHRTVRVGEIVDLDGSDSTHVGGKPMQYRWAIVNKPSTSQASLSNTDSLSSNFTVDAQGDYRVKLTVNDNDNQGIADETVLSTINSVPVAGYVQNKPARVNEMYKLDASASTDDDGDRLSYHWRLLKKPNSSNAVLSSESIVAPEFFVDVAGEYVAQLVVNDSQSHVSKPVLVVINTVNAKPIANTGRNQTATTVGTTITLDGRQSTDVDEQPLTYQWNILFKPTGSNVAITNATEPTTQFTVDIVGDYVVQLVVNDGVTNSDPVTVHIAAQNTRPIAVIRNNANVDNYVGEPITLDGNSSIDDDQNALQFDWALIHAPTDSRATLTAKNQAQSQFTPDVTGTYIVQLITRDVVSASEPTTQSYAVKPAAKGHAPVFKGVTMASPSSSTTVDLVWEAASDDYTNANQIVYDISVATTSSTSFKADYTTAAGALSHTVTGLTQGIDYYLVVRARDTEGNRDSNTAEVRVKPPVAGPYPFEVTPSIYDLKATPESGSSNRLKFSFRDISCGKFVLNFGDGNNSTFDCPNDSGDPVDVYHAYNKSGVYTVTLDDGGTNVQTMLLSVARVVLTPGVIVNVDAQVDGDRLATSSTYIGQPVNPFNAKGGKLNQLALAAGTYTVTNATGMVGANPDFTAWRFNGGANWIWHIVVADDATKKVVFYGEPVGVKSSKAEVAADTNVQNFSGTFTLSQPATLDFMARDYYLPDNVGGVAVRVSRVMTPQSNPNETWNTVVYSNDFSTNMDGYTPGGVLTTLSRVSLPNDSLGLNSPNQSMWLGKIGSNVVKSGANEEIVNLTVTGLTAGQRYRVAFDLFIGASWDGSAITYGPDSWRFEVDGVKLVDTTFSNGKQGVNLGAYSPQRYSDTTFTSRTGQDWERFTGADEYFSLNTNGNYASDYSIYRFGRGVVNPILEFTAASSTATLSFVRYGATGDSPDEYWALGNVTVSAP